MQNPPLSRTAGSSRDGKVLAVDYGRTKFGLAIASSGARIARPLCTMERINRNEDMRRLRELARSEQVRQIVIGLPLRLDGTSGDMVDEVKRFAERVRKQINLPVELVDERLTSWEADRILEEELGRRLSRTTKSGRAKSRPEAEARYTVDAVAATIILRAYLTRENNSEEAR